MKSHASGIGEANSRLISDEQRYVRPLRNSLLLPFDPATETEQKCYILPSSESFLPAPCASLPMSINTFLHPEAHHETTDAPPPRFPVSPRDQEHSSIEETPFSQNKSTPPFDRKCSLNFFTVKDGYDGESVEDLSDEHSICPTSGSSKSVLSSMSSNTSLASRPQRSVSNSNGMDSGDVVFKGVLNQFLSASIFSCKKRFAVLTSSELFLFVNAETSISKQIIPLHHIKSVGWISMEESKFCLKAKKGTTEFIFSHPDSKTATMWVNYIMKGALEQPNENSSEEPSAVKKGFVKMEGVNQRRFLALIPPYLAYYESDNEFLSGFPIHRIHVSQLAVKAESNSRLLIPTSQRQYILRFQNDAERDAWEFALSTAYINFYSMPDDSIHTRINLTPANRNCADCDQDDPQWASTAFFITLCEKCAGIHRSFSQYPGRILSMTLDVHRWSDGAIQLILQIGNANSNKFWESNNVGQKITPGASSLERQQYITDKYERKLFAALFKGVDSELSKQLSEAIKESNLLKCMALYFSGAKFELCNAYEVARKSGNMEILEFIRSHSGLPMGSSFVSSFAAGIDQAELLLVSFGNEVGFKKRRCTLNRGVLHIVPERDSYHDNADMERIFTFAQFLFVSYQPQQEIVKLNLSSEQHKFITFRPLSVNSDTKSPMRQWGLQLCHCFIPLSQFSSEMEIVVAGKLHVCHTAYGEWLESWCIFERQAKLHVIHSSGSKNNSEIFNGRCATELKLSNSKSLQIKPCPDGSSTRNEDLNNVVALTLPNTTLYFTCSHINNLIKWYEALNTHLFVKTVDEDNNLPLPLDTHLLNKDSVPIFVDKCIQYLSVYGILHEGIYRKPGTQSKVLALYKALTQHPRDINLFSGEWTVDEVAGALKKFFRDLPDPVLQSEKLEWWCHGATLPQLAQKVKMYTLLVQQLPDIHRATLRCLIIHLANVADHALENKMDVTNLSLIFGHLLLHPVSTNCIQFSHEELAPVFGEVYAEITRDLILYYLTIFEVTDEEKRRQENFVSCLINIQQPLSVVSNSSLMVPVILRTTLKERALVECSDSNEHEVIVPVYDETTEDDILNYLLEKKRLTSLVDLSLFEVIPSADIERPIHFKELVKPLILRQSVWMRTLVVQNNYISHSLESQINHIEQLRKKNLWLVQFWSCDDSKYRERYLQFMDHILIIAKDPNMNEVIFRSSVSNFQLFHGCDKKHKKASLSLYHLTLLQNNGPDSDKKRLGNLLGFPMDEDRLSFFYAYMNLLSESPKTPQSNSFEGFSSDTNLSNRMSRLIRPGNKFIQMFKQGSNSKLF